MGGSDTTGAWHADGDLLAAYHDQQLDAAARWSVEAHLTSCAACRLQAGALVDPVRLRRLREALIDAVDLPRAGVAERLLVRLGVAGHTARLLAATPALRGSWMLAVTAVLAFAVLAGWTHPGQDANLAFLCVAPLLPLAGIAAASRVAVPSTAAASLALPQLGPGVAGWLLPSLGLTSSSLALATTVAPLRAIGITAGAWILAVAVTVAPPAPSSVLFAVAGQVAFAALALVAAAVLLVRRGRFESDRGFDTTPRFAARRLR